MKTIYTVGHSTRTAEEFTNLLKTFRIEQLADIRTIPRSRKNPQFDSAALRDTLQHQGIAYFHLPGLGGLRHPKKDSVNTAWRNNSFRGYADYMQTPEFAAQIDWLMALPNPDATTVMCAEAVPWRCHRSLIGDAVLARGGTVEDIFVPPTGKSFRKPHTLTKFARVEGQRVWYPAIADETNPVLFD